MQSQSQSQLTPQNICKALIGARLISKGQALDLLRREDQIRQIILKKQAGKPGRPEKEISFIDVVVHLELSRMDQPGKTIDEDLVYRALAASWKMEYKKIDPLKLELKTVTGTISKSFALKHLLLPLQVEEGKLLVATPNPFNTDAVHDVEMVSKLKVKPIVSSKSDVEKTDQRVFRIPLFHFRRRGPVCRQGAGPGQPGEICQPDGHR